MSQTRALHQENPVAPFKIHTPGVGGSHITEHEVPHDLVVYGFFLAEMLNLENEFVVAEGTPAHSIFSQKAIPPEKQAYYDKPNPPEFFQEKPGKNLGYQSPNNP